MATPYIVIYEKFEDILTKTESDKLEIETKEHYLRNAISYYIGTIAKIKPNHELEEIEEDLSESEINLLGLLMNDSHIDQQIFTYNRIINISNEFVKMTGAIDRVKTLKEMKIFNQVKINQILSGMV